MKYITLLLFVLIPLISTSQTTNKDLHTSLNSSGGDISGKSGSISFSIGQVNYLSYSGDSGYLTEGIQQPIIISITPMVNKKEENVIEKEKVEKILTMAAYPNPVTDYFTIEASTYTDRSLRYYLTDLNGKFLKEGPIEKHGSTVDISRLPVAIYILNITDYNKHIKTFKIIKK